MSFRLNLAQTYKWQGDEKKCEELIADCDWSAAGDKFLLGVAVPRDEFDKAARYMTRLGKDEMPEVYYREWPIFRVFRDSDQFKTAFRNVFDKEYVIVASPPDDGSNPALSSEIYGGEKKV